MDDLISRKEAIDVLSMMQGIVAENGVRKGISMAWQQIADLPPAQPTIDPVKRGRWEQVGDNAWKCSRCGEVSCCEGSYCPDCGARMDEVTE